VKNTRPFPIVIAPSLGQIGHAIEQAMQQEADQNGLPDTVRGETPWLAGTTMPVQEGVYRRATLPAPPSTACGPTAAGTGTAPPPRWPPSRPT
jgi:hypothetical protein